MVPGLVEYGKREYCNDIRCPVQLELNRHSQGSEDYNRVRRECETSCRFSSGHFLQWLGSKGFVIRNQVSSETMDKDFTERTSKDFQTAWLFHHKVMEEGLLLVRKVK